MLRLFLATGLLALAACQSPPSAFDNPPQLSAAINARLAPNSCVNTPGRDGSPGMQCQIQIAQGRTQRLSTFRDTLMLWYDRSQIADPAFMSGLRAFFTDLQVQPVEDALAIARQPDGSVRNSPAVNIMLISQCILDTSLPENQHLRDNILEMAVASGGTLCSLMMGSGGRSGFTITLGPAR